MLRINLLVKCQCGCRLAAPLATRNHYDQVKGQPLRFRKGHAAHGVVKHGCATSKGKTAEYMIYHRAKDRCTRQRNKRWSDYGGRGIRFLFASFEQFLAHIGPRPAGVDAKGKALYSLDRIENDGNYEVGNVRWATQEEQNNKQRDPGGWKARRATQQVKEKENVRQLEIVSSATAA